MPTHFRLFLVFLSVLFLLSCSSSHSPNDSDTLPDSDTDMQDSEIQDKDFDSQDSEIIDDYDEMSDSDADQDSDSGNDSDMPETVECLDLRYNENTQPENRLG